jgi:hypothetical protein
MELTGAEQQQIIDHEHLRLLRIAYFIDGVLTALMGLVGLFYVALGLVFAMSLSRMPAPPGPPPPAFLGWFFASIGAAFLVIGGVSATLKFLTARAIGKRRSRTLCLVTAAITCISVPYGTALGVCSFIVLCRSSVMALFDQTKAAP